MVWNVRSIGWGGGARAINVGSTLGGHREWGELCSSPLGGDSLQVFLLEHSCVKNLQHAFDQVRAMVSKFSLMLRSPNPISRSLRIGYI